MLEDLVVNLYGVKVRLSIAPELVGEVRSSIPSQITRSQSPRGLKGTVTASIVENRKAPYRLATTNGSEIVATADKNHVLCVLEDLLVCTVAHYATSGVFLRAGVVQYRGETLVLAARRRSGLSFFIKALCETGAVPICDRFVAIAEDGLFRLLPGGVSFQSVSEPKSYEYHPISHRWTARGFRPDRIVVLDRRPEVRPAIRALSPSQATATLMNYCARRHPASELQALSALCEEYSVRCLSYGDASEGVKLL